MSYDIHFLKRDPGQSWDDAMEALEEQANAAETLGRPPNWDGVVSEVRALLGDVSVVEAPPTWEIDHRATAIQVSCYSGEWSISVPFWSDGDAAKKVAAHLRAISEIVQRATGLAPYDPQLESAVTSDEWTADQAAAVFDRVAESFDLRGIVRG
ncbi:hypothetical protein [Actinomadura miaoliensis]|uniref:Uncharacterized protein n=1 Tax=Actinomadura miaoliensis TaxID=430685 RepID=A0ABP7VXA3_9ACTN